MLSSIGFHISSLSVSLLPGRSWLPGMRVGKLGVRRALAIAEVLRSFDAWGTLLSGVSGGVRAIDETIGDKTGKRQCDTSECLAGSCCGCLSGTHVFTGTFWAGVLLPRAKPELQKVIAELTRTHLNRQLQYNPHNEFGACDPAAE